MTKRTQKTTKDNQNQCFFFPFSLVLSNELFQQVQHILDDKTLAENLYLLDMSDAEAEKVLPHTPPSSRTSPISRGKILPPRPPRSPTTSDSDSDSSDSDSTDSSTDSSDSESEDDQPEANKDCNNNPVAPTQPLQQQPTSTKADDDDILIIEHDPIDNPKDEDKSTIPITFLVSCYVTRHQTRYTDLNSYDDMTSFVIRGDSTSYKSPEYYKTIMMRARQEVLRTTPLNSIQNDGVRVRLHTPRVYYSTSTGVKTEVPPQLQQYQLNRLPEPQYYNVSEEKQGFVSIYSVLDIDYSPLVEREIRKRGQNRHPQQPHQVNNRKRIHPEQRREEQHKRSAPQTDVSSLSSTQKAQRTTRPLTTQNLMPTRTNVSKSHHGPRTMTTIHHRKPIFSRLGPKPEARTESKNPEQRKEQYQKAKMRRQRRRQQAALTIRNF